VFFWFSFLVVFVLNVLVWLYLRQVEDRFKLELQNRLRNVSQMAGRLISEYDEDVDIAQLVPHEAESLGHIFYQQVLDELRQANQLQSALLVSPQGETMISSPAILKTQNRVSAAATPYFSEALAGKNSVSDVQEFTGERFISAFAPIIDNLEGLNIAILIIEARADYFDVLKKKYARDNDEIFTYIPHEIKRLSMMIDDFLKLARLPQLKLAPLDLTAIASRLKMSISDADLHRLIIKEVPAPDEFHSDAGLLEQALLNVVRNAMQATSGQGNVRVSFIYQKDKYLLIEVRDEGPGIPADALPKVFEPFFSTKEKGTGLGLAITKQLIGQLEGTISINSTEGRGTTVSIRIPNLRRKRNIPV